MFGIIVDTFGDMRDEQFRRDEIIENTCLICLNEKKHILETKNEFDDHIKHHHNIWNYVYFLNYLKHKPLKDLSIPEMEAWESTRKILHDWLPLKKSVFLKKNWLDEDRQEEELVISMLSEIKEKSKSLKNDIKQITDRVTRDQQTNQDSVGMLLLESIKPASAKKNEDSKLSPTKLGFDFKKAMIA